MCEPVTAAWGAMTFMQQALVVASVASSAASMYGQHESAKAQVAAINEQNETQADEIARQAGQEMFERTRAAHRERAQARAAGSEAGINLGSNSFLAALQTSAFNQYNDMGLVAQNEKAQQAARSAGARSAMSGIQMPTALSAAFTIGVSGATAFGTAANTRTQGATSAVS